MHPIYLCYFKLSSNGRSTSALTVGLFSEGAAAGSGSELEGTGGAARGAGWTGLAD